MLNPRVGNVVERMKSGGAELWRQKRTKFTCGDIPKQLVLTHGFGDDGKSRGVLLPENLHIYFELSAQAWILYKAPQWNARYPNSCPSE
jgi:hypothetical protein